MAWMEEGPVVLTVGIYLAGADHGLLNLANPPTLSLSLPLVIDHRPPTPVQASVDRWDDAGVSLSWTGNDDPNFYAYVVAREDRESLFNATWNPDGYVALDTIFDAGVRAFRDPLPPVYGLTTRYAVRVTNRVDETWLEPVAVTYGTPAPLGVWHLSELYLHPTRSEGYSASEYAVTARSTTTGTLLWSRDLSGSGTSLDYVMGTEVVEASVSGPAIRQRAVLDAKGAGYTGGAFLGLRYTTGRLTAQVDAGYRLARVRSPKATARIDASSDAPPESGELRFDLDYSGVVTTLGLAVRLGSLQ